MSLIKCENSSKKCILKRCWKGHCQNSWINISYKIKSYMKLSSLFYSAEFCILKLILHKIVTRSFEERENPRITMQVKKSRETGDKRILASFYNQRGCWCWKRLPGISFSFLLSEGSWSRPHAHSSEMISEKSSLLNTHPALPSSVWQ